MGALTEGGQATFGCLDRPLELGVNEPIVWLGWFCFLVSLVFFKGYVSDSKEIIISQYYVLGSLTWDVL